MTSMEGEARIHHANEGRVDWVRLWEYDFILEVQRLRVTAKLSRQSCEVGLEFLADLISLEVKAHAPYIHVVACELNFHLAFELVRVQQGRIVLDNAL